MRRSRQPAENPYFPDDFYHFTPFDRFCKLSCASAGFRGKTRYSWTTENANPVDYRIVRDRRTCQQEESREALQRRHHAERIAEAVEKHPDATLADLREYLGLDMSVPTLARALQALRITFKKKYFTPKSRSAKTLRRSGSSGKDLVRRAAPRTAEALWNLLGNLLDTFSADECRRYLHHCGYAATTS
jgi:hypothetical protein